MTPEQKKAASELIQKVVSKMKITKVVATRSVKGRGGDTYLGLSAAWHTTQDDGGGGPGGDEDNSGMTLKEAAVAMVLLGRTVDIQAHKNARAGGNISDDYCKRAIDHIGHNYGQLLAELMGDGPESAEKK